ncbi:acyltransferase family protein [Catenovulum adriaticum]|uniref:Acyltransferase n=1 Tax=Catenovulum adriaticum TaxID=2984846 RepID=A0ABY7AIN2_9ALTE|nr:acyltransferase family protein [Catenovulum sp. TS8]WAJ69470.1 acyltransferase [Catenovulum sp. TS8]
MNKHIKGIDGLRALAVIAVILYHLSSNFLPGGFTGVDVFFVISGYVVASSLYNRKPSSTNEYFWDFYSRRFFRIYPALLFCLVTCCIVVVLFIPQFFVSRMINETALYAFFGVSNFSLAFNNDSYFSPSTDFNPFVHTWSLGVEEQFYLIYPFVMYFWLKQKYKNAIYFLFAASFIATIYYSLTHTNYAYYLLTSRLWELAAGAILLKWHVSLTGKNNLIKVSSSASLYLGFLFILCGTIFSNKGQFPFPWALLPVVGTGLVINALVLGKPHNLISSLLASTSLQHLGKLSYSLYLWHWPIFSFFRWSYGLQSMLEMFLAITITYILSLISFYGVEKTFQKIGRTKKINSQIKVFASLATIFLTTAVTYKGLSTQGWNSLSVTTNETVWSPYTSIRTTKDSPLILSDRTLYVLGDSHAGAYSKMLRQLANDTGINIKLMSKGGCGVANLREPVLLPGNPCLNKLEKWIEEIKSTAKPDDIIFLASLKTYRFVNQNSIFPANIEEKLANQFNDKAIADRKLALNESLTIIQSLRQITPYIIIDAPKPIYNYIAFRCADWYTQDNPICGAGYEFDREFMEKYRQTTTSSLETIKQQYPNVSVWDPLPALCSTTKCSLFKNNKPLYFDSDHLSGYGNQVIYPSFKQHFENYLKNFDMSATSR